MDVELCALAGRRGTYEVWSMRTMLAELKRWGLRPGMTPRDVAALTGAATGQSPDTTEPAPEGAGSAGGA